jgi:hypothetical protein
VCAHGDDLLCDCTRAVSSIVTNIPSENVTSAKENRPELCRDEVLALEKTPEDSATLPAHLLTTACMMVSVSQLLKYPEKRNNPGKQTEVPPA